MAEKLNFSFLDEKLQLTQQFYGLEVSAFLHSNVVSDLFFWEYDC
jgi:hypothetical protein